MERKSNERGFTLIEVVIGVAIVVFLVGVLGAFSFAGPNAAIPSAARDLRTAFSETRTAALGFDAATLVVTPNGQGFSARVYRGAPSSTVFEPQFGPAYESGTALSETAAPLGAPGFAFLIYRDGHIAGYANFDPKTPTTGTRMECPGTGAFVLDIGGQSKERELLNVPCTFGATSVAVAVFATPGPGYSATPRPAGTCVPTATILCTMPVLTPAGPPACPAGLTPDPSIPGQCDPAPTATPATPIPTPTATGTGGSPLQPGVPTCTGTSTTAISCNSTAPSGGSGTGYSVTYTVTGPNNIGVGCSATYTCGGNIFTPATTYTLNAVYTDSLGDHAGPVPATARTLSNLLHQDVCPTTRGYPANTAIGVYLGPDPDGIHADYSQPSLCGTATPPPTPPPTSFPCPGGKCSYIDNQSSPLQCGDHPIAHVHSGNVYTYTWDTTAGKYYKSGWIQYYGATTMPTPGGFTCVDTGLTTTYAADGSIISQNPFP